MAAPSINGTAVYSTMANRGVYVFTPQIVGIANGNGAAVLAGAQRVQWQFKHVTQTEYDWWTQTLMGGAASLAITSAELWDHRMVSHTFTSGTLFIPYAQAYRGARYWDLNVEIWHLLPLILS